MLSRIPGMFGWFNRLTSLQGIGPDGSEEFYTDQRATLTIKTGKKHAIGDDGEAIRSEVGEQANEQGTVWTGKMAVYCIANTHEQAYDFTLTIAGLPASYYTIEPPMGLASVQGHVRLQPHEEAVYKVHFVAPPRGSERKDRTFQFVETRYETSRYADKGVVDNTVEARWVPLPTPNDVALLCGTRRIILRPWRRAGRFPVTLKNTSHLSFRAEVQLERAPDARSLETASTEFGANATRLDAGVPAVWWIDLPVAEKRASYWVNVRGQAVKTDMSSAPSGEGGESPAEDVAFSVPLTLAHPVYVQYVPWRRLGRDWAFMAGLALLMGWLVWGIPVYKAPIVRLTLNLPKGLPKQGSWQDLTVSLVSASDPEKRLEGTPVGNQYEFHLPGHWYGWRGPFGWNRWGREDLRFTAIASVKDKDEESKYTQIYRFGSDPLKADDGGSDFRIKAEERPAWHSWVIERKATVRLQNQKHKANIIAFEPGEIKPGQAFTIRGNEFGNEPGEIYFGGTALLPSAILHWADDAIKVKAPASAEVGTVQIAVKLYGSDAPQESKLLSIAKPPEMPSASPVVRDQQDAAGRGGLKMPATLAQAKPVLREKKNATVQPSQLPTSNGASTHEGRLISPPLPSPASPLPDGESVAPNLAQQSSDVAAPPLAPSVTQPSSGLNMAVYNSASSNGKPTSYTGGRPTLETQNVIVPPTAKKILLRGVNLGKHGEARMEGAGIKTKLYVSRWGQDEIELEAPHKTAPGIYILEITGEKRVPLPQCTLYRVPNDLNWKDNMQGHDEARDEKQITALQMQGEKAFQAYQKSSREGFWSNASAVLKEAETKYTSILNTWHNSADAVEAHYKLAQIALEMSQLPLTAATVDTEKVCRDRARQEAWIAAIEDSRAQTSHTNEICELIKNLK